MKLILASAGFSTPEIAHECAKLVGKPAGEISIAVINEAYAVEHGDHGWVLDDLNRIKEHFTGSMELVNLLALDMGVVKQRLQAADVIFVVGGHTDYLMSVMRRTGFDQLLLELLETKVYVGSSAGSMVLGKRVSTQAYRKIYGEAEDYGVTEYLGVTDMAIKPHFGNPLFPKNSKEILLDIAQEYSGLIVGLPDESAVVVDGNKQYVVGPQPLRIKSGQQVL